MQQHCSCNNCNAWYTIVNGYTNTNGTKDIFLNYIRQVAFSTPYPCVRDSLFHIHEYLKDANQTVVTQNIQQDPQTPTQQPAQPAPPASSASMSTPQPLLKDIKAPIVTECLYNLPRPKIVPRVPNKPRGTHFFMSSHIANMEKSYGIKTTVSNPIIQPTLVAPAPTLVAPTPTLVAPNPTPVPVPDNSKIMLELLATAEGISRSIRHAQESVDIHKEKVKDAHNKYTAAMVALDAANEVLFALADDMDITLAKIDNI
jgi:hypothetical protein